MANASKESVSGAYRPHEPVPRLLRQRAALIRLELKMLPHPIPTAEQSRTAFRGTVMPKRAMSAVEPIADLSRTSGYVRNVPITEVGFSFDQFVGDLLEKQWHLKAQRLGGLEIDDQVKFRRGLHR